MPGYLHCACGDVFRSLDPKSEMGLEFAKYSQTDALVPDELTVKLWRTSIERLASTGRYKPEDQYLLLDGIPRTLEQAQLMADDLDALRGRQSLLQRHRPDRGATEQTCRPGKSDR